MKLLSKASLIISLTLVIVLSLFYFLMHQTLLKNYAQLETSEMQQDLERVLNAIHYEIEIMLNTTADWATWDESYQFIEDGNSTFRENNIGDNALPILGINAMIFVNQDKQIIAALKYPEEMVWRQKALTQYLLTSPELLPYTAQNMTATGLINFSDILMLVTAHPILSSDGNGPVKGSLIFGKVFNETVMDAIRQRLRLQVDFYSLQEVRQRPDLQIALKTTDNKLVSPKDEQMVEGFTWFSDLNGQPSLLVHLKKSRSTYQQGLHLVNSFLIALTLSGLLFLGISLLLIRRLVLSRLYRLVKDVQKITCNNSDVSARVRVFGTDELAVLSQEVNTMLLALEEKSQALIFEKEKSETLLHNILPAPIAQRMKQGETMIAEHFENVTILFSDLVGFTQWSAHMNPTEVVNILNQIFSEFDAIADKYGLEKIKTIGDAYMVVAGVPQPCELHLEAIAHMALEMREKIAELNGSFHIDVAIRIGISTGEVIAGIIGRRKFAYDLWGDVVNTAARMESHGVAGKIHCTETIFQFLQDTFIFEKRGLIEVKGKGAMRTYFLMGQKEKLKSQLQNCS